MALVVEGEITLGVMGCPNWKDDALSSGASDKETDVSGTGIIMVTHVGCGTWKRKLRDVVDNRLVIQNTWERCFIDSCCLVHKACFCIPDSQTWDSLPVSFLFNDTVDPAGNGDEEDICLLPTCCGSLCKYMTVASGRASVFILRARAQTAIKAWDHAVGVLCVHEAGGQVTDWRGSYLDLAADHGARRIIFPSGGVLVTNGHLHSQILEIISSNS